MYKFKHCEASTKQEKLIAELSEHLSDTMIAFINLNKSNNHHNDLFMALRDGVLGFTGNTLKYLIYMLKDKNQIPEFVEESNNLFEKYMKEILSDLQK